MTGAVAASGPLPPIIANWANTTGPDGDIQSNADVTMMAATTLKVSWTVGPNSLDQFRLIKNGLNGGLLDQNDEFSVAGGDLIHFDLNKNNNGSGTVTITDSTFGDTVVDTFTYTFT